MTLQIATWNVNSLRVRLPHVLDWLKENPVDVLALQETKSTDDQFPEADCLAAGYRAFFNGQRTYNGVAFLVKQTHCFSDLKKDLPNWADDQKRVIAGTLQSQRIRLLNLYIPNGQSLDSDKYQYKLDWLKQLRTYITDMLKTHEKIVILGDFNIAPEDIDVYDPIAWAGGVLVSEPERAAFTGLLELGFQDSFRRYCDAGETFSWWDYRQAAFRRNRGLRIDHILTSDALTAQLVDCKIDRSPRAWERPSDHAPVVLTLADAFSP